MKRPATRNIQKIFTLTIAGNEKKKNMKNTNENSGNKEEQKKRVQAYNNIPKHSNLCRVEKIKLINFTEYGIQKFKRNRHREHEKHR